MYRIPKKGGFNHMKKKLAILLSLTLALAFALAACGGGNEDLSDSKYVGTWVANELSFAGETGEMDSVFKLTLNGDGTGTLEGTDADGNQEVSNITWSLTDDGFKTEGDAKMTFKDDGDGIVANLLGVKMRFTREDEAGANGAAYGYAGDDPIELACYKYMAEAYNENYEEAEYHIPTVNIVHEDLSQEDEYLVYGDFWIENYNGEGDVLKCASGGNYPGCMHISKDDYSVTAFDVVADGESWDSSAREIFGDAYEDFMKVYGDSDARNELRKVTVSDFVNLNGLEFKYYQDEGWDPVELYPAAGTETAE